MMKQILIFGDSITWGAWDEKGGWVQRLKSEVDIKIFTNNFVDYTPIYNLGISGNTTNDLVERFESETLHRLDENEKAIIIFAIGINDSEFDIKNNQFRVSPDKFKSNLQKLIIQARKYAEKIIFVGLTPVDDTKVDPLPWEPGKALKYEYVKQYNDFIKDICKSESVEFVEVFDIFSQKNIRNNISCIANIIVWLTILNAILLKIWGFHGKSTKKQFTA